MYTIQDSWYLVNFESFNHENRSAINAEFIIKACTSEAAVGALAAHLIEPIFHIPVTEWRPKNVADSLGISTQGVAKAVRADRETRKFYNRVPGDHVRLVRFQEHPNAD